MTVLTKTPVDIERQVFDYVGTGAPGTILANAPAGATYRQIDGGVGSMLWQKTTAGWEALQTSSWNQAAADLRYGQLAVANSWAGIQTLTVGGLAIQLTNGTSNMIYWALGGVSAPTFTTRSVGTKLVLYPTLTGTQADFAIGIASNTMWFSLPDNSASEFFTWYGATTAVASLSGTGIFTAAQLQTTGAVIFTGSGGAVLGFNDATGLRLGINGVAYMWSIVPSGHFIPVTAGYDIGASGTRIGTLYGAAINVTGTVTTANVNISGTITTAAGAIADASLTANIARLNGSGQSFINRPSFWMANNGTPDYTAAAIWIRENGGAGNTANTGASYAPRIALHWGGLYATQIALESSVTGVAGRVAILNNPGTAYESFIANIITANGGAVVNGGALVFNGTTSAVLTINTTTGATSDNTAILFQRASTIKHRIGLNVNGLNTDDLVIYNETTPASSVLFKTGGAIWFGTTNGVQLSTTNTGQIVIGELTGSTPNQLIIGIDTSTTISRIQSVHQSVGYTQLNLNPLGGLVTIGAGGLTNSGRYNFASGPYLVDSTASYPALFGSTTAVGLALYWNALAKGYLYSDSGGVGLLDSAGNWRVQAVTTGGSLYGAWTITGNTSIGGTLLLTGAVTFSDNLNVAGTIQQKKGTATYYDTPTVTVSSSAAPGSSSGYPTGHIWLQVTAPI